MNQILRPVHKHLLLIVLLAIATPAQAVTEAGAEFPDTLLVDGSSLILNGAGIRSVFFVDVYAAGLYLLEKSSDASRILEADLPMALELEIVTSLSSRSGMGSPIERGFELATDGNTEPIQNEIERFVELMNGAKGKGDRFRIVYIPNRGVVVSLNGGKETLIEAGLRFKRAVFGIWLSQRPVQKSLKAELLGKK